MFMIVHCYNEMRISQKKDPFVFLNSCHSKNIIMIFILYIKTSRQCEGNWIQEGEERSHFLYEEKI